ncbi:hypothetical protein [Kribbella sp. CA-293567]|uniref:hypothetical protein n=1 Tax=Kribbella sp. CA-293567 TaxID=3002436 RepID=UPI0022DD0900|nr:hypothetical protein [Kribbella sp. CA-293567]WBQ02295.1 hypothetical protein OX958_20130 [Kribbella sp. CA-293567]
MTENQALVLILIGTLAIVLYGFWKQILFLLLMTVIVIFGLGVYSFTVSFAS